MVKKNAIVKRLPAVETLGCSTVICSDKTGTLTQNKMTVQKIFVNRNIYDVSNLDENSDFIKYNKENQEVKLLVYNGMLCNDTKISDDGILTGDPTETALVDIALKLGFTKNIYEELPRVDEIPFDSERKLMTTVHERNGKYIVFTKGGVDELLDICNSYIENGEIKQDIGNFKNMIFDANKRMAKDALRVLAFAYKEIEHKPTKEELEKDLIYVGMYGMIDPPREEAKEAVEKCKTAGIKTVMITGDHKATAVAIAKDLGILCEGDEAITGSDLEEMSDEDLIKNVRKYSVYARVSPEHKVRIVKAWQANGEVVAMTGDGVNDAPALKTADIGCAMGIVGTDVSKEAADVILTDDNFATIVSAVEEGRRIYDNILKAIQFLLSSNVGEIIVLFVAILIAPILSSKFGIDLNLITPLLPIHILWINLVTDSLPALALAVDPPEKDVMDRKPTKKEKGIFTKGMSWRVFYQGIMIGAITLIAFIIGLATPDSKLPTMIDIDGKIYNIEEVQDIEQKLADGAHILDKQEIKVEIGQTMSFIVLALSELVHVFNIRNNKKSIFKTGIGGNKWLFGAIAIAASLVFVILFIPGLRHIFSIPILPTANIIEIICLVLAPIFVVELFKLCKINTVKDE
jgi:Ca2+-transporting ATPase